ncbi:MAG TPA: DUF1513 domain-containing protein [Rhizomicrobium sp.]|nr:DUF1513 domain-containing protein [Rhizomicrobium sp.]
MATRREFLLGSLALAATPAFASAAPAPCLVAAAKIGTRDGGMLWRADEPRAFDLPARGHAPAHLPDGRIVVMSRRPGLFGTAFFSDDPAQRTIFAPSDGYRFAGHASASPDGKLLVTTEFEAASFAGRVAARDPKTAAERAVWIPGGIEPHELVFAKGGSRLVVAMGGLIKDGGVAAPAFNPGGIDSSVVELDPSSGAVLARHKFGAASLSLRHMAVSPDGETIAVACQDQDITVTRPLIGLLRPGKGIEALEWPDPRDCDFRAYVGSVAIDRSGTYVAAASPRGSVLGLWRLADGKWLGHLAIADVCGLTAGAEPNQFWASTGLGEVVKVSASGTPRIDAQWHTDAGFDNHLLMV